MQSRRAFIFFLLGVCMVIWSLCIFYVMMMPKSLETEVYVRPTMTYSSSYKSPAPSVVVPSVRRSSLSLSSSPVSAPQVTMKSTAAPMSTGNMRLATTSSARVTVVNSGGNVGNSGAGYGQVSAGASSSSSRGINYTVSSSMNIPPVVQGFITSASSVSGGRSAEETYAGMQQRAGAAYAKKDMPLPPGVCDQCHWVWDGTKWVCTVCGHDALDGCTCDEEYGYCRCPIDDGWQVWLFMATLVMGYGLLRKQSRRKYSF